MATLFGLYGRGAKDEVQLVIQADYSKKHKQPFIGIARKK
jgi:hypothetical protein